MSFFARENVVDVVRNAGLECAGPGLVGRNEARHGRLDEAGLLRVQKRIGRARAGAGARRGFGATCFGRGCCLGGVQPPWCTAS